MVPGQDKGALCMLAMRAGGYIVGGNKFQWMGPYFSGKLVLGVGTDFGGVQISVLMCMFGQHKIAQA